jgi:hypothetical protein
MSGSVEPRQVHDVWECRLLLSRDPEHVSVSA